MVCHPCFLPGGGGGSRMHFVIQNKGHVSSGVTKVILGLQVLGQSGGGGSERKSASSWS